MRDCLVFYVNDQRHEVRGEAVGITLSDYLRHGYGGPRLTGTKVACAEGDCGACTVLLGRLSGEDFSYQTVDACIAFVYQVDRCHIVTIESLAQGGQLTVVQSAMMDCHGSQCGFCTPGFVMALHGLLEEQNTVLTDDAMRLGLSGNLCRCTGYSQILEAGTRASLAGSASVAQLFDTAAMRADFREFEAEGVHVNPSGEPRKNPCAGPPRVEVLLPSTVDELLTARAAAPQAKLVSGATDVGVQFNHGKIAPSVVIATSGIAALKTADMVDGELLVGAGVTWSQIEAMVKNEIPEYHAILTRFGSPQVRHMGTLVGNLANASPIADSIPFHYVAQSTLELASLRGRRRVPIEDFYLGYKKLDLAGDEVILSVGTPLPTAGTQLKLYKVSKRRDMDISTVTLAFWLEITNQIITTIRIAAGGVAETVVRLRAAETSLQGEAFSLETMQSAGEIAFSEVTPISDVRGSAEFRALLVKNLFAKCWHDLTPKLQAV